MRRFAHACVVGGSGMLSGCSKRLLEISGTVSVMARDEARIRAVDPRIVPIIGDYSSETDCLEGLRACIETHGAPDLLVAWIHVRARDFRRKLAARARAKGRFVQVLGSANADPAHPNRIEEMRAVAEGLDISSQIVVLGFVIESERSRWLTNDEISDGVFDAIKNDRQLSVVGTVEPWSARP